MSVLLSEAKKPGRLALPLERVTVCDLPMDTLLSAGAAASPPLLAGRARAPDERREWRRIAVDFMVGGQRGGGGNNE